MSPRLSRWHLAAGAVAVAVVAVGVYLWSASSSGSSGEFQNVRQVVDALEAGGVPCEDLQTSDIDLAEQVGGQFGSCSIDGGTVNIHVYFLDPDRVAEHIRGNVSVRGQSPTYFTSLVAGSNWVVDSYSDATSEQVQAVLGGEIH